ncbi:MAG: CinA family protein [Glycocaulis sp.]
MSTTLPPALADAAQRLVKAAKAKGVMVVTAESCTGGLVSAAITEIAGSSSVLERGFVTYSNAAKAELLGVPVAVIANHGAVSAETAEAMAQGALLNAHAALAVSITGIAGPDGGSADKPVGTVWFGLAAKHKEVRTSHCVFEDNGRASIREAAALEALRLLAEAVDHI